MKNSFLFFILFLFVNVSFSQPVLNFENSAPQIGDTFRYFYPSQNSLIALPGNSGADVTWNFSSLEIPTWSQEDPSIFAYVNPSEIASSNNFPNSNLAKRSVGSSSQFWFYNANSDSLSYLGDIFMSSVRFYHDPEIKIKYPFTFQNSFSDSLRSNYTQNGVSYKREGKVTVTADAFGTLILPDTTINDVIRIKVEESMQISSGNTSNNFNSLYYYWYKPGIRDYILYYSFSTSGGFAYLLKTSGIVSSVDQTFNKNNSLHIYPNPATDKVLVETATWQNNSKIRILNFNGQLIKEQSPCELITTMDVSDLPNGMYFIETENNQQRQIKKLIISRE
jgi:hypothetical protein